MRRSLGLLSTVVLGSVALMAGPNLAEACWSCWNGAQSGANTSKTAAGFSRTYIAAGGDDSHGCSVSDPCRTLQRAHDRTFINGEINCTDAGGYGTVTITKSITIDCKYVPASINAGTANAVGVTINIPTSSADPLRVVRLRGFTISGAGQTAGNTSLTGTGNRFGLRGISIQNASAVYIEDLVVSDFTTQGIQDVRTTGGQLYIIDTVVRNNAGVGINTPPGGNAVTTIDNVRSEGNSYGLAVGNSSRTMVNRSVFSGNTVAGIEVDAGGSVVVSHSVTSHNASGLENNGVSRIGNSDFAFNTTGVTGSTGSWISYGNNRLSGNTAAGAAPTATAQQ